MGCRSEHWTPENRAVRLLRQQLQFRSISARWPEILRELKTRLLRNRILAAFQKKNKFYKQVMKTRRKVRAWKKQARKLGTELVELNKKHTADPTSVTIADWDEAVKGSRGKLRYILCAKYPRKDWPTGVPYLNVIALRKWQAKMRAASQGAKAKSKKVIQARVPTEETGSQTKTRAQLSSTEQYYLGMAERDAEIKRLEYYLAQWEKSHVLIERCRMDPTSVKVKEWEEATRGTDILEKSENISRLVELARMQEAGEIDTNAEWDRITLTYRSRQKK